jgi:hypothetical protein
VANRVLYIHCALPQPWRIDHRFVTVPAKTIWRVLTAHAMVACPLADRRSRQEEDRNMPRDNKPELEAKS